VKPPLSWQFWALLSAAFAAMTAIFAKIGVENVGSDFATFIRTLVILLVLGAILMATDQWQSPSTVPARTYLFLVLSGLATGALSLR
jgi:transporter family protein